MVQKIYCADERGLKTGHFFDFVYNEFYDLIFNRSLFDGISSVTLATMLWIDDDRDERTSVCALLIIIVYICEV